MLLDVLVRMNKVAFMGRQKTCKLKPAPGALGVESSTSSFCQLFKFINISGLRSQWGGAWRRRKPTGGMDWARAKRGDTKKKD